MAKRASTHESLVVAFELLKRIPKSHQVTARDLHQQLEHIGIERELRTIQRNLELLCEHFDIIRDERSKPYGYRWNKNSEGMALPKLSAQEALLLSLAEEYLIKLLPANITASLDGFFQEAKRKLNPIGDSSKEREWLRKVRVVSETQPLLPPKISTDAFNAISEALYHDRLLNIEYYNAKQEQKSALVMPLGLAQQGQRMYLVCRFDGYDNERSIAVHRVSKATVSSFGFERPKEFKLSQYDADGRFGFGEGEKILLELEVKNELALLLSETPISTDQNITQLGDIYKISATVVDSKLLGQWLSGFGDLVISQRINEHLKG
ncbi:WYL domain-containing protein [Vibrio parahaemolyticus]|uniref:helix-turn-helix transcriptional regulator n=2 Tax=Vibrio parahaemolyticus TaxID=670 RepID=UPI0010F36C1C|nr:WYL domain-containing protein [Vibrio parahaemolyticus]EIZ9929923.1 WYL domain-containing protein [Vibrio parahaemolyticus]ELA9321889.1 WYL domain-containing protein [Vibrio parahaemolyticus]ELB2240905.1 WYL domain-containing protein [Vibrio parahaemolyticus]MBE4368046.1 WYL domain-containing protein [Vibrio parahaemolyticus]MEA5227149.1 WYL domain-containing protein [Vibrio parahaemolyticus]